MVDCKVLKKFAGLEEGLTTQLTEEQFQNMSSLGYVEALAVSKPKTENAKIINNEQKKGIKK